MYAQIEGIKTKVLLDSGNPALLNNQNQGERIRVKSTTFTHPFRLRRDGGARNSS